jgi:hypothetical protein
MNCIRGVKLSPEIFSHLVLHFARLGGSMGIKIGRPAFEVKITEAEKE